MIGNDVRAPRLVRNPDAGHAQQFAGQCIGQRAAAPAERFHGTPRELRCRDEIPAQRLGQRAYQRGGLFFQQARNEPLEGLPPQLVETGKRHGHRHAVGGVARLEAIGQRKARTVNLQRVGIAFRIHMIRLVAHQTLPGQEQSVGVVSLPSPAPGLEAATVPHVIGNLVRVEPVQHFLVDQHVAAPSLGLQVFHLFPECLVMIEEGRPGVEFTVHQGFAYEHLPGLRRIHGPVVHGASRNDHQSVQRELHVRAHPCLLLLPTRVGIAPFEQMGRCLLDPGDVDRRHCPRVQARGFNQLTCHHPLGPLPGKTGAGKEQELPIACTQVSFVLRAEADVTEKTAQESAVHGSMIRGLLIRMQSRVLQVGAQLALHVPPLPDTHVGDELAPAKFPELVPGQVSAPVFQVEPEIPQRQKIGMRVTEAGMLLVRRLLRVHGTLPGILHAQRGNDDQGFPQGSVVAGRQQHPAQAGIHGEPGQFPTQRRYAPRRIHCAKLLKQLVAISDLAGIGGFEERKGAYVSKPQKLHLQHHGREVGAQDLRVRERRAALEVLLRVQPYAHAVCHAAAASLALVSTGPGNRLHRQTLDLAAHTVAADACTPRVHDIANARNGKRRLRNVGGKDDPAPPMGFEDAVLVRRGQAGIERQYFRSSRMVLAKRLRCFADVALAGQEHQHISRSEPRQFVDSVEDALDLIAILLLGVIRHQRSVAHFNGVGPTGDVDDRRSGKVPGEALRVDGRRRDDQLEVGPAGKKPVQIAQQKVDVETALVRLVDNDGVVLLQQGILLGLRQQDAVRHQLDVAARLGLVAEADLEPHVPPEGCAQFLRNPRGDTAGGDTARLRVADETGCAAAQLKTDLRELRGLPRSGFAAEHDDLVVADGAGDLLAFRADRQLVRELRHRAVRPPSLQGGLGCSDGLAHLAQTTIDGLAFAKAPSEPRDPARQCAAVAQHALLYAGLQPIEL